MNVKRRNPRATIRLGKLPCSEGRRSTGAGIWSSSPKGCCAGFGGFSARRRKKVAEPADKPGSVRRLRAAAVIPLGASSPIRSSNLPGDSAGRLIVSLFGLAPGGVCRAGLLPDSRCALTAPFHPCLIPSPKGCRAIGGIFLLHFPSASAAQALPGTAPCGARTFLGIPKDDATAWPTPPMRILRLRRRIPQSLLRKLRAPLRYLRIPAPVGAPPLPKGAMANLFPRENRCYSDPYRALRGAPDRSAASFAAVDGGRCSLSFAYRRRPSMTFASASSPAPWIITTNSPLR